MHPPHLRGHHRPQRLVDLLGTAIQIAETPRRQVQSGLLARLKEAVTREQRGEKDRGPGEP